MARRRLHGLQRVLGTNALAATAYGNVGSSIYYALGLVAGYALGLTPVVFVISGFIFYLTAATYSEATAMYPEAGGSSSFARRAFNEFWSFFAAWGQMLNYTITIAISAFFVPHYLGGVLGVGALRHLAEGVLEGDVDAVLERAVAAGATVREAAQNFVSGDRFASIIDPFGIRWSLMTRVEDLSEEESNARVAEWAASQTA